MAKFTVDMHVMGFQQIAVEADSVDDAIEMAVSIAEESDEFYEEVGLRLVPGVVSRVR